MAVVKKTPTMVSIPNHFCPGCGHGILNRLIAEVIEEKGYDMKPRSIAVVGVTDKPGFGRGAANGALISRIADRAYFVHPKREELFGKKCWPNITSLPETVDCVVLCTSCKTIPGLLTEAGEKGIGVAVIYASGFSEEGTEEGCALEEEVKRIAAKYDMCVLGPNCMGFINNIEKVNMWGGHTHWDLDDDAHGIAIIAQSGFVSAEILNTDFCSTAARPDGRRPETSWII